MELYNEFEVGVPLDDAWSILTDVERIAPCMPGAELREVEGEEYRGAVKVKVGPITTEYRGAARFLERDDAAHRAVLLAEGRESRGQGNAAATITATLEPADEATRVTVSTDLQITGKVAQFGRGVLADVSTKLLGQFVDNLEKTVVEPSQAGTGSGREANGNQPDVSAAENGSVVRPVGGGSTEPVDLLKVAGTPVTKRIVPLVGAVVVLIVLARLVTRSRRKKKARRRAQAM
jgi:carbon monoxide dehydrogenase subunit G